MNPEYPDFFARFYDLIYHQLRDSADSQFFLRKTEKTKGKILEIGVGTGRLFGDYQGNCLNDNLKEFVVVCMKQKFSQKTNHLGVFIINTLKK